MDLHDCIHPQPKAGSNNPRKRGGVPPGALPNELWQFVPGLDLGAVFQSHSAHPRSLYFQIVSRKTWYVLPFSFVLNYLLNNNITF